MMEWTQMIAYSTRRPQRCALKWHFDVVQTVSLNNHTVNPYIYKGKKVKFTLGQATKAQRGSRYIALLFLQSRRWKGCWSSKPRPGRFTPGERPGTNCIGDWVGRWDGLDGCGKSLPPPGFEPRTVQPVASCYTDWAIPAPSIYLQAEQFFLTI